MLKFMVENSSFKFEILKLQLLKILKPVKLSSFAQEVLSFLLQLRGKRNFPLLVSHALLEQCKYLSPTTSPLWMGVESFASLENI